MIEITTLYERYNKYEQRYSSVIKIRVFVLHSTLKTTAKIKLQRCSNVIKVRMFTPHNM